MSLFFFYFLLILCELHIMHPSTTHLFIPPYPLPGVGCGHLLLLVDSKGWADSPLLMLLCLLSLSHTARTSFSTLICMVQALPHFPGKGWASSPECHIQQGTRLGLPFSGPNPPPATCYTQQAV